jgi:hypothetical protein
MRQVTAGWEHGVDPFMVCGGGGGEVCLTAALADGLGFAYVRRAALQHTPDV